MTPIQSIAIERAVKILKAINAKYAILMPDGGVIGELRIEPERQERGGRGPTVNRFDLETNYSNVIENLEVGHSYTFVLNKGGDYPRRFKKVVTSKCRRFFGSDDDFIVALNHNNTELEVLRIN